MPCKTSIAILLMSVATAYAHPRLETSNPARGATLTVAPKEIRMSFSEGLIANFTGLELKDAQGKIIPTGKAALASGDDKRLIVPIAARLAPGNYIISWHAVSVDTHRVSGSYAFKLAR